MDNRNLLNLVRSRSNFAISFSFLKGIDLIGESIGYNYVEVNPDNIDFRIGNKNAEFFTIHARDVEVDILDDCRRFFEWPTYWNNLGNK